jgi:hypothetical protein
VFVIYNNIHFVPSAPFHSSSRMFLPTERNGIEWAPYYFTDRARQPGRRLEPRASLPTVTVGGIHSISNRCSRSSRSSGECKCESHAVAVAIAMNGPRREYTTTKAQCACECQGSSKEALACCNNGSPLAGWLAGLLFCCVAKCDDPHDVCSTCT